jgi:FkbM family methyltransferase
MQVSLYGFHQKRGTGFARWTSVKIIVFLYTLIPKKSRDRLANTRAACWNRLFLKKLAKDNSPDLFIIRKGPLKGSKIFTYLAYRDGYVNGNYEPEVTAVLNRYLSKGMTMIDIGAHHGYLALLVSTLVGEEGRVFAFEPAPENISLLSKTIEINSGNSIEIVPFAASSESSKVKLSQSNSSTHSVLDLNDESATIEVEAVTIDSFLKESNVKRIDFVKIDVEGHEIEVLKGMKDTIKANLPMIICEIHNEENWHHFIAFIKDMGYETRTLRSQMPRQILAYGRDRL